MTMSQLKDRLNDSIRRRQGLDTCRDKARLKAFQAVLGVINNVDFNSELKLKLEVFKAVIKNTAARCRRLSEDESFHENIRQALAEIAEIFTTTLHTLDELEKRTPNDHR